MKSHLRSFFSVPLFFFAFFNLAFHNAPRTLAQLPNDTNSEKILGSFHKYLVRNDRHLGQGFSEAQIFGARATTPIRENLEPRTGIKEQYVVFENSDSDRKGGVVINARPTRLFLDEQGQPAYIAFDAQAVRLLETSLVDPNLYFPLRHQGFEHHPNGFASPLGRLKGISKALAEMSLRELHEKVGIEGSEVSLEFESGVKIQGLIEKYTLNNNFETPRPLLISFKEGTTRISFGVHQLFTREQGVFDLLLTSDLSDSNSLLP